ncbi:MAG: LacI family DNA-binding transcriptional regulator [Eubacteriales bacterium]|nr:LacI family DNA-binding transcriptional regulator [Eubacteriales bacterium]
MDITIKDIAADANVSVSTVSRVLNGSKTVSDERRVRVLNSIEKYHYRPNAAARSLVTKSTSLVAVLQADLRNPITAIHLKQISDVCMRHNKIVLACDYDFDNEKALVLMDKMLERNIDGLIFQGVRLTEPLMKKLRQFQCPVVLGNQVPEYGRCEFTTVTVDSYGAARDVTEFFLREGHQRIAYIGGSKDDYTNGCLRLKGFQDTMKKAGLPIPKSYIVQGNFSVEAGKQGMRQIYENSRKLPTAVIAGSDIIAVGVIQYLKTQRLRVPEDISVFGCDDSISDIFDPPLSTVHMFDQGEILYDALFGSQAMEEEKQWIYFPYQLIRRSSTKSLVL